VGILNWKGLPVISGNPWRGVSYFCTVRLIHRWPAVSADAAEWSPTEGASTAPFDTFNLGDHVGDEPASVHANRQRLAVTLPGTPVWLQQVHGTDVFDADSNRIISRPNQPCKASTLSQSGGDPTADAAITQTRGRVLCIMTADCLPVVLSDDKGTILGLAHAGWRGLAQGVLESTLTTMQERVPNASWRAWIGPAISQSAFEVGDEVRHIFADQDAQAAAYFLPGRPKRWQADLSGLAYHRLKKAGVTTIGMSGLCTHAHQDMFYSYRRDGRTGRMATVAWLDELATYPD